MSKIVILLIIIIIGLVASAKEYGYFDYSVNTVETCRGPKRKDCCINTYTLIEKSVVNFKTDCKENMSPTRSKIIAYGPNRQKVRLQMDKPCKHIFIFPILKSVFNVTDNCVVLKHSYSFSLNFTEIALKYYNGMFIYGNWTFESMFFNDICNLLCLNMKVNLSPKRQQ